MLSLVIVAPLLRGRGLSLWPQSAFAIVSMTGWLGLLLLLVGGGSAISTGEPRVRAAVRLAGPLAFTLFQIGLFVDVRIYEMFRFHFNGVVWHTVTAPGGWSSLHIPIADVIALCVGALALAAGQVWLLLLFERKPRGAQFLTWKRATIAVAVFSIADRCTFAAFDLKRDYRIERAARVVPFHQPFTIRRIAKTWFGWRPGRADVVLGQRSTTTELDYPKNELTFVAPAKPLNVLWIVLESWRHDAFDEQHAPEIWEISKRSLVFEQHLSGGNNTTFGVFSMFYGLYGSYRSAFLAENRGPVMIDRLRELDYRFAVYSSFPMTWPEFRKYLFVDVADSVKDKWPEKESAKNDPLVIDSMLSFIDHPAGTGKPFFGFVLLDSSHAPYTFPDEFGRFQPYAKDARLVRYVDATQRAPELRNRYYNSVLWESHQVGRLWKELDARGLLDSTAIVITGDHGEEFNEHGFWTHSGGYTPEQIHVPLVLWWPGAEPRTVSGRTSHLDLTATFMKEALGARNPPSDYCEGRSLLDTAPADPFMVSCGWSDCAVVDDHGYVVFGLENNTFDVLDSDYRNIDDPADVMSARGDRMLQVMTRMRRFQK